MREKIIEYLITLLLIAFIVGCVYALYTFCIKYDITLMDLVWNIVAFAEFIVIIVAIHEILDDLNVFTTIKKFVRKRKN